VRIESGIPGYFRCVCVCVALRRFFCVLQSPAVQRKHCAKLHKRLNIEASRRKGSKRRFLPHTEQESEREGEI